MLRSIPIPSGSPGRMLEMNAYAIFAADEALRLASGRVADLRLESTQRRLWSSRERTGGRGAVGALISSLRDVLSVDDAKPFIPALSDYPFRS
jgi:hypothetical protein